MPYVAWVEDRKGDEIGLATPANAALTDIVKRVERGELQPDPKDRRFKDPAWDENPLFFGERQAYLAWAHFVHELITTAGLERKDADKAAFGLGLLVDALAPTNFPLLLRARSLSLSLELRCARRRRSFSIVAGKQLTAAGPVLARRFAPRCARAGLITPAGSNWQRARRASPAAVSPLWNPPFQAPPPARRFSRPPVCSCLALASALALALRWHRPVRLRPAAC